LTLAASRSVTKARANVRASSALLVLIKTTWAVSDIAPPDRYNRLLRLLYLKAIDLQEG